MISDYDDSCLLDYDLSSCIFDEYGLLVEEVIPHRSIYILKTDKGDKVFKKIANKEDIKFINEAMDYIRKSFDNVLSYYTRKNGEIILEYNNNYYCIMNKEEGIECDYNNPVHILLTSKSLAKLHNASKGFTTNRVDKIGYGDILNKIIGYIYDLDMFYKLSYLNENEFSCIYRSNYEKHRNQAKKSLNILIDSKYCDLSADFNNIALIHHDLAHHNIIIKSEEAYFIDFDYAILDLKVHDICNLINKTVKNFGFDIEKAKLIINEYNSICKISQDELEVLYGMLYFPYDFYSISKDYFLRNKNWSNEMFINRLNRKVGYYEDRGKFLEEFNNEILKVLKP
ncbi:MAG: CotS family spore coat protein [Clostridiaceae bacterium]